MNTTQSNFSNDQISAIVNACKHNALSLQTASKNDITKTSAYEWIKAIKCKECEKKHVLIK